MAHSDIRLFFDISSMLNRVRHASHYTGIHRVVSMIVAEMSELHDPSKVFVSYLDPSDSQHKCLSLKSLRSEVIRSPGYMHAAFFRNGQVDGSRSVLRRYAKNPLKMKYYQARLDLMARIGRSKEFERFGVQRQDWIELRRKTSQVPGQEDLKARSLKETIRYGDKLILLDSTWGDRYVSAFKQAKASGCQVYNLVHDLIPLKLPETTPGAVPVHFERWLLGSLDYTDHYLTVSEATRTDLESFLREHGSEKEARVLRLAQDRFIAPDPVQHEAGSEGGLGTLSKLQTIVGLPNTTREALGTPYVLCVGTIEPRKNIWRLALAWKLLADQGVSDLPRLVIAGKESIMIQSLKDLLEATGNIYGYVSLVESPREDELATLYERCLFLAMPSMFEGWGLPVGEALSYGKTAVVSRASSLPEVGGDLVEYCNPHSVSSIAQAVARLVDGPDRREELERRISTANLRSWRDVAQTLYSLVIEDNATTASAAIGNTAN